MLPITVRDKGDFSVKRDFFCRFVRYVLLWGDCCGGGVGVSGEKRGVLGIAEAGWHAVSTNKNSKANTLLIPVYELRIKFFITIVSPKKM
jgi:hypothetical protein